jgi:glycosyltransferase involved in cell wall biosynthesis
MSMALRLALVHSFYKSRQPSGENAQVEAERRVLERSGLEVELFAARTDDLDHDRLYRARSALRVATGRGASPLDALASFSPDVVHVHNLFPNFGRRWLADVAAPVVTTLHNFRFACAAATLFRDGRVCTDCPDGRPWSAVRHRCYRGSLAGTVPLFIAQRGGPARDPLLARADRILCIFPRQRRMLERAGFARDRVVAWSNFLPARLEPRRRSGSPRRGCVYAGRLSEEKGVVDLVASWTGETPLTVVGDGPLRRVLERAAAGRNVAVVGQLPRAEVIDLLCSATALALPSLWPEVMPLAAIEALACGVPIIVHRTSDMAQVIVDAGVGVAVADPSEYPRAVEELAGDAAISERCRRTYERRYAEKAWTERILDLYRQLAGPGAPPSNRSGVQR